MESRSSWNTQQDGTERAEEEDKEEEEAEKGDKGRTRRQVWAW